MRIADLATGTGQLHHAWKNLKANWEQTQAQWHDPVSHKFEEEYLAALEPLVLATLERLNVVANIMHSAGHECS